MVTSKMFVNGFSTGLLFILFLIFAHLWWFGGEVLGLGRGLGLWGFGFQLMGFGACAMWPSGCFGVVGLSI